MTCSTNKPNGTNADCVSFLKEAVAMVVADAGSLSFDNVYELDNAENWRVKIQEEGTAIIIPVNGTEVTAAEGQTETTGNGITVVTGENSGNVLAYLNVNQCDYNEIMQYFKGGSYDVMWFDADNNILGYNDGTNLNGYLAQLFAPNYGGVGTRDGQTQMYKLHVHYLRPEEQNSPFIVNVGFSYNTLQLYSPVGMNLVESTAYDSGTGIVVMDIFKRCTNEKLDDTTLDSAEGEVIEVRGQSDASGVTVTPAWNGTTYKWDITIADGAGRLASGVSCEFRIVQLDSAKYEYTSNTFKVTG